MGLIQEKNELNMLHEPMKTIDAVSDEGRTLISNPRQASWELVNEPPRVIGKPSSRRLYLQHVFVFPSLLPGP